MSKAEIKASKQVRQLKLQIPAAAGNLGPGLDTIGLALGLYCRLTFELLPEPDPSIPMVQYSGAGMRQSMPKAVDSLTYKLLNELWRDNRSLVDRVRIRVDSDIPLGSGLGGRTSAILGALWADNIFNDRVPITSELLARMAELEGHSETFAASLIGGFVVSARNAGQKKVTTLQHEWPHDWATIVALPDRRLTTSEARAVLPKTAPIYETIFNLQRTALMVSAVVSRDENAMKEALVDKIHEPYRSEIIPEFPAIKQALAKKPIIGCVLCGGGPSVLVIVNRRHRATVLQTLESWAAANTGAAVLELEVDRQGIREMV
jgi:homoserine kinase